MNKNELKQLVKVRIKNQISTIDSVKHQEAKKEAEKLFNNIFTKEVQDDLDTAVTVFKKSVGKYNTTIGSIKDIGDNYYMFDQLNRFVTRCGVAIENLMQHALGSDWTDRFVSRRVEGFSPEVRENIKASYEHIYNTYYVRKRQLEKMEAELIAIIQSSKTAAKAAEALTEMGIKLDIPEAKPTVAMLPAVVKLTVDTKLFNEPLTTEN